ncbi:RNA polymerase sigma-70 factor [Parabacteroides sp. OttesenSCG-928-G06]|nr:RNA polymerase sigma-70 factor [Parabacteroides sp. OttesenSCG-928-K15]MDL2281868.1 RNA polymerase sigma-70 factor [Parabacteroides sp. OttesenSCG-928-G06]
MDQVIYIEFDTLYKRFYKKAFLFTKSYVHDVVVAEDITSEAILKLWEVIRREKVEYPDALLLKILKNKALDYLKHEVVKEDVLKNILNAQQEELEMRISLLEACDPEEIFTQDIQQIIKETLRQFPEQTRHIFVLSRYGLYANKEIAEITGLSVKSVEYHISKVLKTLRVNLKDYLPSVLLYFFF